MKRHFVIAMECEAEAVRPALREGDVMTVSGVGKVNAAAAAQKAIDAGADLVINAGVCGGLDADMEVGDAYAVKSAVEYDFDLAAINGTCVGQKNERNSPYIPVSRSVDLPLRVLATGDRFNDDEDDFVLLKKLECSLRDMEGAAIADVCDKNGVPCLMVKSVSDVHGRGSMTGQYAVNLKTALKSLGATMIKHQSEY